MIIEEILAFLPFSVLHRLGSSSSSLPPAYHEKKGWIARSIPECVLDVMGMDRLLDVPFFVWDDDYMGRIEYTDRIRDLPSSILMGQDRLGRVFISLRTSRRRHQEAPFHAAALQLTTLSQRYSGDRRTWTYAVRNPPSWMNGMMYFCQNGVLQDDEFSRTLRDLLEDSHPVFVLE